MLKGDMCSLPQDAMIARSSGYSILVFVIRILGTEHITYDVMEFSDKFRVYSCSHASTCSQITAISATNRLAMP